MLLCSPSAGHLGCLSFTTVLRPSMIKLYGFPYHTTPMLQLHDVSRKGTIFSTEAFSCPQYFRARTCVQLRMFAVFLEARGPGAFPNLLRIFKHWIWNHVYYTYFHIVSFCIILFWRFRTQQSYVQLLLIDLKSWPAQAVSNMSCSKFGTRTPATCNRRFPAVFPHQHVALWFQVAFVLNKYADIWFDLPILQFYDSGKKCHPIFFADYLGGKKSAPLDIAFCREPLSGNAGLGK